MNTLNKDFAEVSCNYCGRSFKRPYPSMQEKPIKAPTLKEWQAINEMVFEDLKYHQNKTCFNSPSKSFTF